MHQSPLPSPPSAAPADTSKSRIMLRLLQAADGDLELFQGFQAMIWDAYSEADYPFGMSEEGMCLWWEHQQQTTPR